MVAGRSLEPPAGAEPTLLFLALPDQALPAAARALAGGSPPAGSAAVHLSGALGLDVLAPAGAAGWTTGSFHPLRPFAGAVPPAGWAGVLVAVDASTAELQARLEELARRLGGRPRRVPAEERTLYHAAAVTGSNYVVALAALAAGILESAGWTRGEALEALLPLLRGAVESLEAEGLPAALTGPVRRGDVETVERQLAVLEGRPAAVYRILGLVALDLAREAGLEPEAARRIEEALTG